MGPVAVPTPREAASSDFDWAQRIWTSERARSALDFAARVLQDYGASGKPIWPPVPSSPYGAFVSADLDALRVLVVTYDARTHGWGAAISTRPDVEGFGGRWLIRIDGEASRPRFTCAYRLQWGPSSTGPSGDDCRPARGRGRQPTLRPSPLHRPGPRRLRGALSARVRGAFVPPFRGTSPSPSALSSSKFGRNPSSSCSTPGRCSRQKESTTCLVVRLRSNGTRSLRRSCEAWFWRRRLGAASGSRRTSLRLRRTRWSSASSPGARSRRRRARTPSPLSIGLRQAAWHVGCVTGSFPSPSRRARFGLASLRSYARTGRERSSSFPFPCRIHGGILSSLTSAPDQIDPCISVPSSPRFVSDTRFLGGAQRLTLGPPDTGSRTRLRFATCWKA